MSAFNSDQVLVYRISPQSLRRPRNGTCPSVSADGAGSMRNVNRRPLHGIILRLLFPMLTV